MIHPVYHLTKENSEHFDVILKKKMLFKYYILQTLFLTIMFFCYFVDACDYSRLQCHTKTGGLDLHTPTFCNEAGGSYYENACNQWTCCADNFIFGDATKFTNI